MRFCLPILARIFRLPRPLKDNTMAETKNLLIIGITGRLGAYMVPLLKERNIKAKFLVRDVNRAKKKYADLSDYFEFVSGDVTNKESLQAAFTDVTQAICLQGPTNYFFGSNRSYNCDFVGIKNIIDELKEQNAKTNKFDKIVVVSSIGVDSKWKSIFLNISLGNYGKWKKAGEDYIKQSGLDYVIVRPGMLTNESHTGNVLLGQGDTFWWKRTTRGDIALTCLESMAQKSFRNVTFEMLTDPNPKPAVFEWANYFGKLVKDVK